MGQWLGWKIGNGTQVAIGIDPFIGGKDNYKLSGLLISELHNLNIQFLAQIRRSTDSDLSLPYCLLSSDLGLYDNVVEEYNPFVLVFLFWC